jgi:protein disulfide isomerase family A protein 3
LPLVGFKNFETSTTYDNAKLPVVTIFSEVDVTKNPKGYQYLANRVVKVAKDYKGKLLFNIADKKDYSYVLSDYGLGKLEGKRDIGVGLVKDKTYYKMTTATFSTENLAQFVKDYFEGKLIGIEKVR